MKKTVYYFSGTGNSLKVAGDIAEIINAELISIPLLQYKKEIIIDSEVLGFVFPIYNQGPPAIVRDFIERCNNLKDKYIFAIGTYAHMPCLAMEYLEEELKSRGGLLGAGFTVQMPYNYMIPDSIIHPFRFRLDYDNEEKQRNMFEQWDKRKTEITDYIENRKTGRIETSSEFIERLGDMLNLKNSLQKWVWLKVADFNGRTNLKYPDYIHLMDSGFSVNNDCSSCSICSRICPVDNITMDNGLPHWHHNCEQCFACLQWCPEEAIQFGNSEGKKRYHHPQITLNDMLEQKEY
ncbi:MAG: EFR1 family ferrodoxin [bacterium]